MKNDAMSTKLREGPMSSSFSDLLRDALRRVGFQGDRLKHDVGLQL